MVKILQVRQNLIFSATFAADFKIFRYCIQIETPKEKFALIAGYEILKREIFLFDCSTVETPDIKAQIFKFVFAVQGNNSFQKNFMQNEVCF